MRKAPIEQIFQAFKQSSGVTTDTRSIEPGCMFFALQGPNFNGNQFAMKALESGASFSVIDDPALFQDERLLLVEDVLTSLQQLAGYYRNTLNIPVIAITGSNGKTTTKELVHAVLSARFKTSTTQGNLNNHIGIPLTLLRIATNAEMAVIEMGANHQKEIEGYCLYTKPGFGLITNCGKAHLEGFGSLEGIRKGKGELFDFLKMNDGSAFVCSDFEYFHSMIEERKMSLVNWYGTGSGEGIRAKPVQAGHFLEVEITQGFLEPCIIKTKLVGDYNIYNVLSAVAIGKYFGVQENSIKEAIEGYTPDNSRSQLVEKDGNTIIMDAYNANPSSMAAAINNFASLNAPKKILVLGAMAELGGVSLQEHEALIRLISSYKWYKVVLVGGDFARVNHPYPFFLTAEDAAGWWNDSGIKGATLLLKGSRSMAMEKVLARP